MSKIKYSLFLILALSLATSCTDDFEELNTNPVELTAANVDVTLLGQAFARAQYYSMHGV